MFLPPAVTMMSFFRSVIVTNPSASIVDDVNRDRSRYEQLKRFAVLERDFEMDRGELTPTLKLRRRVVLDHFADEVEGLYDGSAPPAPHQGGVANR